mgnify:CR=1 FL=1
MEFNPGAFLAPVIDWLNANFHGVFALITRVIEAVLGGIEAALLVLPAFAVIAIVVGVPLGIAMARNEAVALVVRPVLDLMQTMPAFVYLIPAIIFFGVGAVVAAGLVPPERRAAAGRQACSSFQ